MKKSVFVLIAGASAFAAASAFAGHHGEKKDGYDWEAKMAEKFAAIDTDASGNISGEEYLAYKRAEAEKSWAEHELGDDGELSLKKRWPTTRLKWKPKKPR